MAGSRLKEDQHQRLPKTTRQSPGKHSHPETHPRTESQRSIVNKITSLTAASRYHPELRLCCHPQEPPTHFKGSSWSLSMLSASLSGSPRHVCSTVIGSCSPSLQLSSSEERGALRDGARPHSPPGGEFALFRAKKRLFLPSRDVE